MKELFTLRTVRKKIVMLSKITGLVLIFSYILSASLPVSENISFGIWFACLKTGFRIKHFRETYGRSGFFGCLQPFLKR